MELTHTDLIDILAYIDFLDDEIGLNPETVKDVRKCIYNYKKKIR